MTSLVLMGLGNMAISFVHGLKELTTSTTFPSLKRAQSLNGSNWLVILNLVKRPSKREDIKPLNDSLIAKVNNLMLSHQMVFPKVFHSLILRKSSMAFLTNKDMEGRVVNKKIRKLSGHSE